MPITEPHGIQFSRRGIFMSKSTIVSITPARQDVRIWNEAGNGSASLYVWEDLDRDGFKDIGTIKKFDGSGEATVSHSRYSASDPAIVRDMRLWVDQAKTVVRLAMQMTVNEGSLKTVTTGSVNNRVLQFSSDNTTVTARDSNGDGHVDLVAVRVVSSGGTTFDALINDPEVLAATGAEEALATFWKRTPSTNVVVRQRGVIYGDPLVIRP